MGRAVTQLCPWTTSPRTLRLVAPGRRPGAGRLLLTVVSLCKTHTHTCSYTLHVLTLRLPPGRKSTSILPTAVEAVGDTPMIRLDKIAKAEGLECELCKCIFNIVHALLMGICGLNLKNNSHWNLFLWQGPPTKFYSLYPP